MPAAFIGHGSPMNAIERNQYTDAWRGFGAAIPKPRAILVVSAHWYTNATAVTAMAAPRTLHDFYGFPEELFAVQYPAPGLPELAAQVADVVKPQWVGCDVDSWGLDHGTWSVLRHIVPDASVPVVQLSLNAFGDARYHFELGQALQPLRSDGVLIVGSGNIVHNLGAMNPRAGGAAYDWALRFDTAAHGLLTGDPSEIASLTEHPDYATAAPTPDHFLPLLYIAGLAGSQPLQSWISGHVAGSISMAAYTLGHECDPANAFSVSGAVGLNPGVPAIDSNL